MKSTSKPGLNAACVRIVIFMSLNHGEISPDQLGDRLLTTAGVLIGMSLAGFFDGIVLHQILQWHHMLSNVQSTDSVKGLQLNTLADGLFHIASYVLLAIGLITLWRAHQQKPSFSSRLMIGAVLLGAGIFNLVEGLVNHHLLQIHHVKPGPNQLLWDLGFLAIGLALIGWGWVILKQHSTNSSNRNPISEQ